MGDVYEAIDDELTSFITKQHVFFVATAPSEDGHVNLSPKGLDTFRILGPRRVAYLDLTGSGVETIAHLEQNGRITFMFCAFDGPPLIVRLYGRGRAVPLGSAEYADLAGAFPEHPGSRAVIVAEIDRISDSCGFAVPKLAFSEERDVLTRWAQRKSDAELAAYRGARNAESIDGLPGLTSTG